MKATQILTEEHNVIWRVLDALESAAGRIQDQEAIDAAFFIQAAEFIKGFADGCHHLKEEGVLFEAMKANGVPVVNGPIGVMLDEHEKGRAFTQGMRRAAEKWLAGDEKAKEEVARNAKGYVALLRQHIIKEDNVLFPMADQVIPESEYHLIEQGFDQVEHEETGEGVHEKYLALAESLAAQAA